MTKLRQTCAVAIVTAVLAVSAFADSPGGIGTIDSPGAPAPAPTQTTTSTSTTTTIILTILSLIR